MPCPFPRRTHTTGLLASQLRAVQIAWADVAARASEGLTLLHRAVRSGNKAMVHLVVRLGQEHGAPFGWEVRRRAGYRRERRRSRGSPEREGCGGGSPGHSRGTRGAG